MSKQQNEPLIVQLTTGDMLMGQVTEQDGSTMVLKNVLKLIEMPGQEQDEIGQVMLWPFMPFSVAQDRLEVVMLNVVTMTGPQEDIKNKYLQAFDQQKQSSIITPDSGLIT